MPTYLVMWWTGTIGCAVVQDLFKTSHKSRILVAGKDFAEAKRLSAGYRSKRVQAVRINIDNTQDAVKKLKGATVVINCVQYYFNVQIMKLCLEAGVHYVDLGGLFHETRKQLKLSTQFKHKNLVAVLGCGAAPGITNILTAYGSQLFKNIDMVEISFATIDSTNYQQDFMIPYSFQTIVDELTKKPAVFEKGKLKFVKPFSGKKMIDFGKDRGKHQWFYTLHSELATLPLYLKHKQLQNLNFAVTFEQSFIDQLETLIRLGFTSPQQIAQTTATMNQRLAKPGTRFRDREVLQVIIEGKNTEGEAAQPRLQQARLQVITTSWDGRFSAGTLDTAVPCSIIAQMIGDGQITTLGVHAPESALNLEQIDIFFEELKKRRIDVKKLG